MLARQLVHMCMFAGGFGWRMTDDEVAALDAESAKVPESTGAPFEKW